MMETNTMESQSGSIYEKELESIAVDTKSTKFQNISKYILLGLTFLLPIFFIPSTNFPFQFGKVLIISVGATLAFIFWIIHQLKMGSLVLPKSLFLHVLALILVTGLASSLLSNSFSESVFGVSFESGTLLFTLILFLLLFVSSQILNSSKSVLEFYLTLFASSAVVALYHIFRVFIGADFLDFGILNTTTSSILGRWNDLGILFGFSSIVSIVALEFFNPTKLMKGLLYTSIVLSVIFTAIVNSMIVWATLAVLSLALFVYLYFNFENDEILEGEKPKRKISYLAITLLILSILFIIFRSQIGSFMSDQLNISQIEARPSFTSTLNIAKSVLTDNPGFGIGPNRFSVEWGLNKSLAVNNTIFWNVNFNYGIGIIPTTLITYGILGFLAWVFFLGMFLYLGIKILFTNLEDSISRFVTLSSFIGALYLWVFSIFTVPGVVIVSLTYLMTGIFLASLIKEGLIGERMVPFSSDSRLGFVSVFLLIVFLIGSAGMIYVVSSRYVSSVFAQKAFALVNSGDLEHSLNNMNKALVLAKTDNNYRLMSQIHVARIRELLSTASAEDEEALREFQGLLGQAISNAQAATEADSADYRNWVSLGSIYESIIPLGVEGAYESAKGAYQRALEVNPTNPLIDLALARIEVINRDNGAARVHILNALQKKNNYIDAIFLLSQIEINEGNIIEATRAVEAASLINPNNTITFFQLGYLKFSQRDFEGAIQAFERATTLTPPYSNAKYFLGLSYYAMGRMEDAILEFEDIEELNPDNQEIKSILLNLRNGQPPLAVQNEVSDEIIEELPVQE